MLLNTV